MCSNQPLMGLRAYEVSRIRALAEESVQLQQKTFQRWIQAKLRNGNMTLPEDFVTDFRDGRLLMQLCVDLCGATFIVPKETSNRFQQIENIHRVFSFLRQQLGTDLSDIGAEDIVEGKVQPTLRVIWCVILAHHVNIEGAKIKENQARSEKEIKSALLDWCRVKCRKYDVNVSNFGSSWKSGLPFMALMMEYLQDDERKVIAQSINVEGPISVLDIAFETAERKVLAPRLLDAEEFALLRHDEKSLMTYLLTLKQSIEQRTQNNHDGD